MQPLPASRLSPAAALLAELAADEWGQVAVGLYDTARLVAIAPWLAGHQARVEFLCHRQLPGGQWGGVDGYEVVPTLSATTALLAELRRDRAGPGRDRLAQVAADGLAALRQRLDPPHPVPVPDTIGVELILPALLAELADLLAHRQQPAIPLPPGFDSRLLDHARARFAARGLSRRAWACLEVFGPAGQAAPFVVPAGGAVGCSPAATAAWLGGRAEVPAEVPDGRAEVLDGRAEALDGRAEAPDGRAEALAFLRSLQARGGGPVPGVAPITYFEPAWVLNSLATGEWPVAVPPVLLDRLAGGLEDGGAPAAPGLPPDSDDTAAVLSALLRHGRGQSPQVLLDYRADGYFRCFQDERNPSITANAHVLEALALHLHRQPELGPRLAAPARMAAAWLVEQQLPDGSWQDKWHASPYYASWCCVLALSPHHPAAAGPAIDQALDRVVAWARATQRPDGSWGRWQGTVEETSYAVQLLARAAPRAVGAAIARGRGYLADPPPMAEQPPLWHAKDLYLPTAVVRAARLAALGPAMRPATGAPAAAAAFASVAAPAPPAAASTVSRAAAGGTG